MKPGVNLWSRALIYNRPTRERERELIDCPQMSGPVSCTFAFLYPENTAARRSFIQLRLQQLYLRILVLIDDPVMNP